ncbi:MAG: hypothetical protein HRT44_10450 [Bdellovibrionales bacterium]|nr:hypothetical protein [Bdellovibrionales bacterium]NQZ19660.1 hypothetical protein [Bdellovibrionales bacterium]
MKSHFSWTIVQALFVLVILTVQPVEAFFSFLKCDGDDCRICLATNSGSGDKVCSKRYNRNFEYVPPEGSEEGGYERPVGFRSLSEDLADDMANKLVGLKKFPEENFEVKDFYKKYAEYNCEQAKDAIGDIDRQINLLKKDQNTKGNLSAASFYQAQTKYLNWKKTKIRDSMKEKNCP